MLCRKLNIESGGNFKHSENAINLIGWLTRQGPDRYIQSTQIIRLTHSFIQKCYTQSSYKLTFALIKWISGNGCFKLPSLQQFTRAQLHELMRSHKRHIHIDASITCRTMVALSEQIKAEVFEHFRALSTLVPERQMMLSQAKRSLPFITAQRRRHSCHIFDRPLDKIRGTITVFICQWIG